MGSPAASPPSKSTCTEQQGSRLSGDDRAEFVESTGRRTRSGRGVLTGVLVGAGLWAAILVLTGAIKL